MAYLLDNLGDYNVVRNDLKKSEGNVETLYKNIEEAAVAKAGPHIFKEGFLTGAGIGVGICTAIYGGYKYYKDKKYKKKALKTEPKLKDEFTRTMEVSGKTEVEETSASELKK